MNRPHRWILRARFCWAPFCLRCGLIRLNNRATEKAAKQPCPEQDE